MKTNIAAKTVPKIKRKLRLPDQIDLTEEDGTMYHGSQLFCCEKDHGRSFGQVFS